MPVAIALIMFGIGLELKLEDFKRVFFQPKAILIGLACQLLLLPFIAFCLIFFWPIDPIYKIGIMLIAACPGGTASNLVTKILNGRVALSISLTAFNSIIILFTIPFLIDVSYEVFGQDSMNFNLGFGETMKQVLYTVVIPVIVGIAIGQMLTDRQLEKIHTPLKYILPALLMVGVVYVIISDNSGRNINYLNYLYLLVPLICLNLVTIFAGFYVGKRSGLKHTSAYTIGVEMGLQNSALALFIADQLLEKWEISLIAILYGSFSLITTFAVVYLLKRYRKY